MADRERKRDSGMGRTCATLALVAAALGGCAPAPPPVAQLEPPAVTVARPLARTQADYDEYTGKLEAVETVEIRARVSGYLVAVNFKDGDIVEKGQLLFEIDPRTYQAEVDKDTADIAGLKARLALAEVELKRYEQLVKTKAGTREDLDKAIAVKASEEAEIAKAEAVLERAKLDLEFTKITAPIRGRVSRAQLTVGNLVSADNALGPPLTTIVSIDPIYVYFDIDEQSLLRYQKQRRQGDKIHVAVREFEIPIDLALADSAGFAYHGVIDFAENKVDRETGTIRVRGIFRNEQNRLSPGLFARVRIPAGDEQEALLVPDRAVGTDQGLKYLFVVNDQNVVERRDILLGRSRDGMRVVLAGVGPADWVIVDGLMRVRPGIKVTPERQAVTPPPAPADAAPPATAPSAGPADSTAAKVAEKP